MEVIPAIIAKNFKELEEKIKLIESCANWVQIDVMDGDFVQNFTWNNPEELKSEDFSIFLEAHLMIFEPEKYIDRWISSGVKRIIVHIEAIGKEQSHTKKESDYHLIKDMAKICHENGVEFGIALNPETPIEIIYPVISQIDLVLFLAVSPGFGGQKFKENVLGKIKSLRKNYSDIKISVDGGINLKNAKKAVGAGADIIIVGSYIMNSKNPSEAINLLKNV